MFENVLLFSLIFVGDTISIGLYTVCIVDMYDNVYILSLSLISDRDQSLWGDWMVKKLVIKSIRTI